MAKQHRKLDSGPMAFDGMPDRRQRRRINSAKEFMFTPSGACGCCATPDCIPMQTYKLGTSVMGTAVSCYYYVDANNGYLTLLQAPANLDLPDASGQLHIAELNYTSTSVGIRTGHPDQLTVYPHITVPWSLAFTYSGSYTQCGLTITPTVAPSGWITNAFAGKYVQLGSSPYLIASNTTTTITLDANSRPTVNFAIAFDYWRNNVNFTFSGRTVNLPTPSTGWITNRLIGMVMTLQDSNGSVQVAGNITANTPNSFTLDCALPTLSGGDFSLSSGTFIPSVAPDVWNSTGGKQYGFRNLTVEMTDPDGIVQYTPSINQTSSSTSLLLYTPPPDGTYTGWTWRIIGWRSGYYWGWRFSPFPVLSGSATPCVPGGSYVLTWAGSGSPGWTNDVWAGLAVTYDGVAGTVVSNTSNTLTVSLASPMFGERPWALANATGNNNLLRSGGNVKVCTTKITDTTWNGWVSSLVGLSLTVRGAPYTIASVQDQMNCTLSSPVNMTFDWYLDNYTLGTYYDLISGAASQIVKPANTCQYNGLTYAAHIDADNTKLLWHTPLPIKQYYLSSGTPTSNKGRLFFGPNGDYYFEFPKLPVYGDTGTASIKLVCGDHVSEITYTVIQTQYSHTACAVGTPRIYVTKSDNGYLVVGGNYYGYAFNCTSLQTVQVAVTVPAEEWEAADHKIGYGGDNGATALCPPTLYEMRGLGDTATTNCATFPGACAVPDWEGPDMPEIEVVIQGGALAGTYVLTSPYGSCCWSCSITPNISCSGFPQPFYGLTAVATTLANGTMTVVLYAHGGIYCDGLMSFCIGCGCCSGWSSTQTFSPPFSNTELTMPVPTTACNATSIKLTIQ